VRRLIEREEVQLGRLRSDIEAFLVPIPLLVIYL